MNAQKTSYILVGLLTGLTLSVVLAFSDKVNCRVALKDSFPSDVQLTVVGRAAHEDKILVSWQKGNVINIVEAPADLLPEFTSSKIGRTFTLDSSGLHTQIVWNENS